jgi:hypothetical protein
MAVGLRRHWSCRYQKLRISWDFMPLRGPSFAALIVVPHRASRNAPDTRWPAPLAAQPSRSSARTAS